MRKVYRFCKLTDFEYLIKTESIG